MTVQNIEFSGTIRLEAWNDSGFVGPGHDPRSDYVERFWLPILGPSTTWFLRRMASYLDESAAGCLLELADTARLLGLGSRPGRHAPFLRTVARAVDFKMAEIRGSDRLAVRRRLPAVGRSQLTRLPERLRLEHAILASQPVQASSADLLRRRGEQLAQSLLELGETPDEAERQLLRRRFHPAMAHQCVVWAMRRQGAQIDDDSALGVATDHPSSLHVAIDADPVPAVLG